jgi:hypothetical protein
MIIEDSKTEWTGLQYVGEKRYRKKEAIAERQTNELRTAGAAQHI